MEDRKINARAINSQSVNDSTNQTRQTLVARRRKKFDAIKKDSGISGGWTTVKDVEKRDVGRSVGQLGGCHNDGDKDVAQNEI